jgi:hypothetical protein
MLSMIGDIMTKVAARALLPVLLLTVILPACGKSEKEKPLLSGDFLIPESAAIIGYVDVPTLAQYAQIKALMVTAEEQLGIKLDEAEKLFFWVSYDTIAMEKDEPAWCIASKANAITDITAAFEPSDDIDGIATYTIKNEEIFRAAIVSNHIVIGTEDGLKMSIQAAKGDNLTQSPRAQKFSEIIAQAGGALSLAFVPTPEIKAKMLDHDLGENLMPLLKNCMGIGIAAAYENENLYIVVSIDSSKDAVKLAADEIMKLKENIKPFVDQFGKSLAGEQDFQLINKSFSSFIARANEGILKISIDIPGKLLELAGSIATNFAIHQD